MSLVNIYWVKIWSSVYFCSLPVLSISTLWLLMFASYLLSFTMPYTWEVVHKHLREGGIRPTWWHWWQEQDPPLCKHTHLVMSSIAVCRTFDLGRELQYPRQGWTFPVNHLNNTVRSGPPLSSCCRWYKQGSERASHLPKVHTEIVWWGFQGYTSATLTSDPEFLNLFNSEAIVISRVYFTP